MTNHCTTQSSTIKENKIMWFDKGKIILFNAWHLLCIIITWTLINGKNEPVQQCFPLCEIPVFGKFFGSCGIKRTTPG